MRAHYAVLRLCYGLFVVCKWKIEIIILSTIVDPANSFLLIEKAMSKRISEGIEPPRVLSQFSNHAFAVDRAVKDQAVKAVLVAQNGLKILPHKFTYFLKPACADRFVTFDIVIDNSERIIDVQMVPTPESPLDSIVVDFKKNFFIIR